MVDMQKRLEGGRITWGFLSLGLLDKFCFTAACILFVFQHTQG